MGPFMAQGQEVSSRLISQDRYSLIAKPRTGGIQAGMFRQRFHYSIERDTDIKEFLIHFWTTL